MTQWLLSVVGVVIISYLIKLLLPENSTKNLIAFILSAVCVLVIINPLNSIFNSQQSVDFDFVSFELDNDYLQFAMQCKKDYYFTISKSKLKSVGVQLKYADFIFYDNEKNQTLKKILIKKSDLVIIENGEHINISYLTKKLLSELFSISEKDVEIYE